MAVDYDKQPSLRQRKFKLCRNATAWKRWSSYATIMTLC